jgi:NADH dehydrogenase (ubiquinone) flavoprotein 2
MVCGSEQIKQVIEEHLGIKEGETTADGLFTLREVTDLQSIFNSIFFIALPPFHS